MTMALEHTAAPALCVACGVNPRGAAGKLSRCIPCFRVAAAADRKRREELRARAAARAALKQRRSEMAGATGDSEFTAAIRKAEAEYREAGESVAQEFRAAGRLAEDAVESFARRFDEAGKAATVAVRSFAREFEKATAAGES